MIDRSRVTVVVPTRNEAHNIGRFLRSLPAGLRLIVVDSSTDETARLVSAQRPDNTTIVLAEANIPEARQIGADLVSTPWILFTDADVELSPDYLDVLGRLRVGSDIGGVIGTKATAGGHERYHYWFRQGQRVAAAVGVPAATGSNMLIRTEVVRRLGGFDPRLSVNEDTELMFRVRRAGYRVPFVPELEVRCHDHRRLERGLARKWGHSLSRCALLWAMPASDLARRGDWGYWRDTARSFSQLPDATG